MSPAFPRTPGRLRAGPDVRARPLTYGRSMSPLPVRVAVVGAVLTLGACSGSATPPASTTPSVTATVESPGLVGSSDTATTATPSSGTSSGTSSDPTGAGLRVEPKRSAFVSSARVTVQLVQWDAATGLDLGGTVTNLGPVDGTLRDVLSRVPVAVEVDGARVELAHPVPQVPVGSTTTIHWTASLAEPPKDLAGATLLMGTSDANQVRMPLSGAWTAPRAPLAHSARGTVVATRGLRATVLDSLVRPAWATGQKGATLVDLRVAGLGLVSQYGGYRFNDAYLALVDGAGTVVPGESTATSPLYLNVLDKGRRSDGWVTFALGSWKPPYTLRMTLPDFAPAQTAATRIPLG